MIKPLSLFLISLAFPLLTWGQYDKAAPLVDLPKAHVPSTDTAFDTLPAAPLAPLSLKGQCTWYPGNKPEGNSVLYQVYEIRGQWALMKQVELSEIKAWVYVPAMGGCWVVPGK